MLDYALVFVAGVVIGLAIGLVVATLAVRTALRRLRAAAATSESRYRCEDCGEASATRAGARDHARDAHGAAAEDMQDHLIAEAG